MITLTKITFLLKGTKHKGHELLRHISTYVFVLKHTGSRNKGLYLKFLLNIFLIEILKLNYLNIQYRKSTHVISNTVGHERETLSPDKR